MASRKSPLFDTATTIGKIMTFLGVSALCGVLAAGLIFPLAASGGAAAATGQEILDEIPAELMEEPLSVPSTIYANDGTTELATFYAENRQPVDLEDISDNMVDALIAIEDERYYEHGGVDPRGLARAFAHNATSDSQQGASTITQQYVNNVLVNAQYLRGESRTTISGQKTYADKIREMKLAVDIEDEMTKDEIIEGYLNIVLFGGRNYGVEAASQYYWGISAADLSLSQAATLAGMVQSPNGFNPEVNPEASEGRRDAVLDAMLRTGAITEEEHDEATSEDLNLEIQQQEVGCTSAELGAYFCDYVRRQIEDNDAFGPTQQARSELLNRGGLEITTTLDPELQEDAEEEVVNTIPVGDSSGAGSSIVSVEPGTGNILSMAQNTEFDPAESDGNTELNFNVDAAYGGGTGFQGGSTLKPYVAAAYLEQGGEMDDTIDASTDSWSQFTQWDAQCLPNGHATILDPGGWSVDNVIDGMKREMTVDYGLYWSINTATTATAEAMDLCNVTGVTDSLDVHQAQDGAMLSPEHPSFILGAYNFAPMTQAAAYAAFANEGEYCRPRALLEVEDANGNSYDVPPSDCEQVLESDTVAQLNDTLINIAEEQVADGNPEFPMAGKTGTNDTTSSTWFIGYSSGVSTAAWVGSYTDMQSMRNRTINGTQYEEFFGSTLAGPMWHDYMTKAAPNYSTDDFPESDDSPFDDRRDTSRYNGGGSSDGEGGGDQSEDDSDGGDSDGGNSDGGGTGDGGAEGGAGGDGGTEGGPND